MYVGLRASNLYFQLSGVLSVTFQFPKDKEKVVGYVKRPVVCVFCRDASNLKLSTVIKGKEETPSLVELNGQITQRFWSQTYSGKGKHDCNWSRPTQRLSIGPYIYI